MSYEIGRAADKIEVQGARLPEAVLHWLALTVYPVMSVATGTSTQRAGVMTTDLGGSMCMAVIHSVG